MTNYALGGYPWPSATERRQPALFAADFQTVDLQGQGDQIGAYTPSSTHEGISPPLPMQEPRDTDSADAGSSGIAQKVVGIEQPVGNLRAPLQPAANGCRDRLAGFAAQAGQLIDANDDPAHAPHFVEARGDFHTNAQLLEHPAPHVLEGVQAGEIFQPFEQALFLLAGQAQDAQIGAGRFQQSFMPANANAGWTWLADRMRECHELRA